jgi:hypothetical protein
LTGYPKDAIINTYTNTQGNTMTTNQAMFVFIAGLLLTLGAVGGVEASVDAEQLTGSLLLAVLGLLGMYAGTLGFRNAHYFD